MVVSQNPPSRPGLLHADTRIAISQVRKRSATHREIALYLAQIDHDFMGHVASTARAVCGIGSHAPTRAHRKRSGGAQWRRSAIDRALDALTILAAIRACAHGTQMGS